jgi:predicted AlkP superfamily pyrophosphatase or phosphodiesterase
LAEVPLLPDYGGACVSNIAAALLEPDDDDVPSWLPASVVGADQVVFLVIDGLGWEQWRDRTAITPTLNRMHAAPLTTIAPSTTATAMTSICTGLPPGEHGVIGYRMDMGSGDVLNVLKWSIIGRDSRSSIPPEKVQPHEAFLGHRPAIVTRAEFKSSGFTQAHLDGVRFTGYRTTATLVAEIGMALRRNEPFVYAYYDGIDKVAHEYGLAEIYDAELRFVDQLIADILDELPMGAALVVTADHGQVDVGDNVVQVAPEVMAQVASQSGEGRFRWLHARPGRVDELLAAATEHHGDTAWVVTRDQTVDEGWFGPRVTDAARSRLGDVALVARADVAYFDKDDTGPYVLIGRHGSLTSAEMLVPLFAFVNG